MAESHQVNLSNCGEWRDGREGTAMHYHPQYRFIKSTLLIFALVSILTVLGQLTRMVAMLVWHLLG